MVAGELPRAVDQAEEALIASGRELYQARGSFKRNHTVAGCVMPDLTDKISALFAREVSTQIQFVERKVTVYDLILPARRRARPMTERKRNSASLLRFFDAATTAHKQMKLEVDKIGPLDFRHVVS